MGISRPTVTKIYHVLRKRIFLLAQKEGEEMSGDIELDESYFGPKRIRGKRGRGAGHKIPVFGMLKRNGKVYTEIVQNCSRAQLLPIIKGNILECSTLYTDGWKAYGSLVYNFDHYRVHHSHGDFARGKNHVNGMASFWSWGKRRLQKFNGTHKKYFYLHLKECEWRFNHREGCFYVILLKELRKTNLRHIVKSVSKIN